MSWRINPFKMKEEKIVVPIAFNKSDRDYLKKKADANRLKLSSYLRFELTKELRDKKRLYYFFHISRKIFPKDAWANHQFLNGATKQITRILYASTFIFYLLSQEVFAKAVSYQDHHYHLSAGTFLFLIAIVVLIGVLVDFLGFIFALVKPFSALRVTYFLASIFLFIFSPITFLLLKVQKLLLPTANGAPKDASKSKIKEKILELVWEADITQTLDPQDKKLILSVASFKDRIAREIMVPRIDVMSLNHKATIAEAAIAFEKEGYSRMPIYKDTVDNIVGVLLFKDLLNFYIDSQKDPSKVPESTLIETLLKPIVYAPETKKISQLLQEFRAKQLHLAIIVDEYGGTEGIVTIEDILEEIVGEIADEYDDKSEELLFVSHPDGGWVVDAKMNINDVEKELGVLIPNSPEYDTIGGYIFERAGAIPTKGWRIHHENFDLEILSSSDRSIDKIRIIPAPLEDL